MAKKKQKGNIYLAPNQNPANIIEPSDDCLLIRVKEVFPLDKEGLRMDKENKKLDDLTDAAFMSVHYNYIEDKDDHIPRNKLKTYTIQEYYNMCEKFEIKNYWDLERKTVMVDRKTSTKEILGGCISGSF